MLNIVNKREKLYSKVKEKQNRRKFFESLYIFIITPDEVEKHVGMMRSGSSDNCIFHFDIKIFLPQYCN